MTNKDKVVQGLEAVLKSVVEIKNFIPLGLSRIRVSLSNSLAMANLQAVLHRHGIQAKCISYMYEDPFVVDFDYQEPNDLIELIKPRLTWEV